MNEHKRTFMNINERTKRVIMFIKSKVHGWSMWLSKILDLVQSFLKYTNGPCGLQFVTYWGHPCTFGKSWGLNVLQSANHRDHPCTLKKLGTKSKILVNHKDHSCILLFLKLNQHKIVFMFIRLLYKQT
ncbi:hypothetical protein HanIR_Chr13g0668671 [Helianthus annuus]|nr:hypothetical protein HanIR_Chr13g0668671 [Helianthus annuus]